MAVHSRPQPSAPPSTQISGDFGKPSDPIIHCSGECSLLRGVPCLSHTKCAHSWCELSTKDMSSSLLRIPAEKGSSKVYCTFCDMSMVASPRAIKPHCLGHSIVSKRISLPQSTIFITIQPPSMAVHSHPQLTSTGPGMGVSLVLGPSHLLVRLLGSLSKSLLPLFPGTHIFLSKTIFCR